MPAYQPPDDCAGDDKPPAEVVHVPSARSRQLRAAALLYDKLLDHPTYQCVTAHLNDYRADHLPTECVLPASGYADRAVHLAEFDILI